MQSTFLPVRLVLEIDNEIACISINCLMIASKFFKVLLLGSMTYLLAACGGDASEPAPLLNPNQTGEPEPSAMDQKLKTAIADNGVDYSALILPADGDFAALPTFPGNPINAAQVELGRQLFHDTLFALDSREASRAGTYSCASCHHVQAGFKSGVAQGVGDGGIGFGFLGEGRLADQDVLKRRLKDPDNPIDILPDVQDIASPTILNSAYQEVMLWNGQFGNAKTGALVNAGIDPKILQTEGTPKAFNERELPGLETQAMAGMGVHRLRIDTTELSAHPEYLDLFVESYPEVLSTTDDVLALSDDELFTFSALAIANYERTVLANEAPFQRWLKGDLNAMTENEKEGAALFFGKANCADCHQGPALSSLVGANDEQLFFAIGFNDLVQDDVFVIGNIKDATKKGRGGFTGDATDDFRFKIPTLYNLKDSAFLGHGASFSSVLEVVRYKNAGIAQNPDSQAYLDARFKPLGLNDKEIALLTEFIENALYDDNLRRHVPVEVISGNCFPVNDTASRLELGCEE